MATLTSLAKKLIVAFGAWIIGMVVLNRFMGPIAAFLVATILAVAGFVAWVASDDPELGEAIAGMVLDSEGDLDHGRERHERAAAEREGRRHLGRIRRGDRRDGT